MTVAMPDPAVDADEFAEPALREPVEKVSWRVALAMGVGWAGLFWALLGPAMFINVIKLQRLLPADQVPAALATVSSVGAVMAFLANPIFGRISDRTTGRFGRRRPWLIVGVLGLGLSLMLIAGASQVWMVVLGWAIAQVFSNAAVAAMYASVADQVPMFQRGKVTAFNSVGQQVGIGLAAFSFSWFGPNLLAVLLVPALVGFVAVGIYAAMLPDVPLRRRPAQSSSWKEIFGTFWINPVTHRDFALTWLSRFLIMLSMFMFTTYRLLYLEHNLHMTEQHAAAVMAIGVLIYSVSSVVMGQLAGWLSDYFQRRKVFVWVSAAVFGVGTAIMIFAADTETFYLGELVLGLSFGVYSGVDGALAIDVLPRQADAGKDLGVLNIANAGPQALAPGAAFMLINVGSEGNNYDFMLGVAAGIAVLGALCILPIRKVR